MFMLIRYVSHNFNRLPLFAFFFWEKKKSLLKTFFAVFLGLDILKILKFNFVTHESVFFPQIASFEQFGSRVWNVGQLKNFETKQKQISNRTHMSPDRKGHRSGDQDFLVAAAKLWNRFSSNVTASEPLTAISFSIDLFCPVTLNRDISLLYYARHYYL